MTQSWRTLGTVALSAMIAGWLVVRVLRPSPEGPRVAPSPEEAVETTQTIPPPETAHDTERSISPPERTGSAADPLTRRDQDLTALENALLKDHRIRDLLFSYPGIPSFPSVITYRRAMEFWEPAFTRAARSAR